MGGRTGTGDRRPCIDGSPLGSITELPDILGGPWWEGVCPVVSNGSLRPFIHCPCPILRWISLEWASGSCSSKHLDELRWEPLSAGAFRKKEEHISSPCFLDYIFFLSFWPERPTPPHSLSFSLSCESGCV